MAVVLINLRPNDSIRVCYHGAEVTLRTSETAGLMDEHHLWMTLEVSDDRCSSHKTKIHAAIKQPKHEPTIATDAGVQPSADVQ